MYVGILTKHNMREEYDRIPDDFQMHKVIFLFKLREVAILIPVGHQ